MAFILSLILMATASLPSQAQVELPANKIVPELISLGLRPIVRKMVDKRLLKLENQEDQYFLEVRLGKLTKNEFEKLKSHFKNVSGVTYSPTRDYELTDFLHPAIQAVANQVFLPQGHSLNDRDRAKLDRIKKYEEDQMIFAVRKNGITDVTNCWNTSTEILCNVHGHRDPANPEYFLYWPGRWEADEWFSSDDYSDSVRPTDLKPGDVITIKMKTFNETSMLQHTAILITDNLVFERTDSSENDPYRISLKSDVEAKYKRVLGEDLVIEYRRFGAAGKKKIEPPSLPSTVFEKGQIKVLKDMFPKVDLTSVCFGCETGLGGGCDPAISAIHRTKIVRDPRTGRGLLLSDRETLKRFVSLKHNAP